MNETINYYCGYTANMKPMQAGRVSKQLGTNVCWWDFNGKNVENYATIIAWNIFTNGYSPNMKIEAEGTRYELRHFKTGYHGDINKIQYDFAVWLTKNFKSYDEVIAADRAERKRLQASYLKKIEKKRT